MPSQSAYHFANLLGTVYTSGNVLFTRDGNTLLSPLGNRVTSFDLVNNKSRTFSFQNRKNVARIALSPDSKVLISVDEDGRALLVNFSRSTVLHHFNFKKPVKDIKISPDNNFILVTHGSHLQVWRTPSHLAREFAPFHLHRTYTGHHDDAISVEWSADSRFFISTSKDMTAKLYTLHPLKGYRPKTFAGHRDIVLKACFSNDQKTIYTVSKDGVLFVWRGKAEEAESRQNNSDEEDAPMDTDLIQAQTQTQTNEDNSIAETRWGIASRHFFNKHNTHVTTVAFHAGSSILVVGFSSGLFALYDLSSVTPAPGMVEDSPELANIHTLSISQERITSLAINPSGEWLAFGASKLGQLLVWEWQSESYVLKQQGHYFDMNCMTFSPDGQTVVTGGDDGKVKIWNVTSGFCFVTFSEHSSAISSVEFAKQGSVVFSASLDGTVRAFDLIRYRNFRTFTSPTPVQFTSLAVDPSGEVVCAGGSGDGFEIYMWSTQTGKLLDIMPGHEGPISGLHFSPSGDRLASCSWDRTVRTWDIFGRSKAVETFQLNSDALSVAFSPTRNEIAVSTLDGQISFWDVNDGSQRNLIEGRKDIAGGRKLDDRITSQNNASGKSFNSLCYNADGSCILAGGNSKYVCLYEVRDGVLLKRFQISENLSLDGTQEFLDSRNMTEVGPLEEIDDTGDMSDLEDRLHMDLPGAQSGDKSKRRWRREARTKAVRFAPTGRIWAAASSEGLLIYSLDETTMFDPFDLDIDITPTSIQSTVKNGEYLKALAMSFRLNEQPIIRNVYQSIPQNEIPLIAKSLPPAYVDPCLRFIAGEMGRSPHLEYNLFWAAALLSSHGRFLKDTSSQYMATFRALQKGLTDFESNVLKTCDENKWNLAFYTDAMTTLGPSRMEIEA